MLLEKGVCYDQCFLLAKLLAVALLHFVLQGQTCLLTRYLLSSYFCIPVPYDEKDIFFFLFLFFLGGGVSPRKSCRSS